LDRLNVLLFEPVTLFTELSKTFNANKRSEFRTATGAASPDFFLSGTKAGEND
jgi:hypothetical protein